MQVKKPVKVTKDRRNGSFVGNCLLCMSQPIVMHLACILLRLSMPEALVAATLNAAASLGKSDTQGSLEIGKLADMVVIDAPRYRWNI